MNTQEDSATALAQFDALQSESMLETRVLNLDVILDVPVTL